MQRLDLNIILVRTRCPLIRGLVIFKFLTISFLKCTLREDSIYDYRTPVVNSTFDWVGDTYLGIIREISDNEQVRR